MEQPTAQRPVQQWSQSSLDNQKPVTTIEESPTSEEKDNANASPLTIAQKSVLQRNQLALDTHKPVTTIEESPTLEEKKNSRDNASLELPTGAQLCTLATEEEREVTSPSDESFLNGIAHEFDELEKNNFSKVTTTTECKCSLSKSLTVSKAGPQANSTPSRSNFLCHISPVTLLPPHATNGKTTATQSSTHQQQYPPPCTSVPQSPPVIQTPETHLQQQRPPPPPTTTTTTRDSNNCTIRQTEKRLSSFRTPSTTQWIKAKSFQSSASSSSSVLSCDSSPQPFNGGKLTPPLCKCGKRSKRKLVTNPGPNQGRPFFSCPGGRGSSCQYFRWESSSPNRSPYFSDSTRTGNLSSEYS